MAWLDRVLAIPVIGLHVRSNMALAVKFLELMAPVIDENSRACGEIDIATGPADLQVGVADGFRYTLSHDNLLITYKPSARAEPRAGMLPEFKVPEIAPYSRLIKQAMDHLERVIQILGPKKLEVLRFGVVATASLDPKNLPPGVAGFIEQLGKSWPNGVFRAETNLLNRYRETEVLADQCHHQLRYDKGNPTADVAFALDWQRVWKKPLERANILELREAHEAALGYFEDFGSGVANAGAEHAHR